MTQTASIETLSDTARALVAPGKGILAADESTGTIKRRFDSIGAESTETNRRDYREMLFRTPGASEFISGVILYDETIRQKSYDGTPLVRVLSDAGMMPGIKVDTGAKELAGAPGESVTEGLDGLRERLAEYAELGSSIHQVACGHHHRAGHSQRLLPRRECSRPGPLCRADSRGGDGSHGGAGSAHGRRSQHRPVLRRHGGGVGGGVPPVAIPGRCVGRNPTKAEYGAFWSVRSGSRRA